MEIKIEPGVLNGTVNIIPSKSQAHRALICAALADKPSLVECEVTSNDIDATAECLRALGAEILFKQNCFDVSPIKNIEHTDVARLPCLESGSTFRFLLPIAAALGREVSFELKGRLPERPLSPLYEELVRNGCCLSPQGSSPFTIKGKLSSGNYSLNAGVSSQFISGLLFSLPLLQGDSKIELTGKIESFPYIELTLSMLEKFAVEVIYKDTCFYIHGAQKYRSPGKVRVEGDWSNAAFWFAAGAVGGNGITCTGLDIHSRQGDRAMLDILARFGASIEISNFAVTVSKGELRGIEIDAGDIPDLVPILSVVAAAAKGETVIRNAGRLRGKESDRLAAATSVLSELGTDIKETKDGLIIHGGIRLKGGTVSSWRDHRIAMSAAIAAVLCDGPVIIQDAGAVNKSYPGFFDERSKLLCPHNTEVK